MSSIRFLSFPIFAIGSVCFFFDNANAQQMRQADTEFVAPKKSKLTLPKKVEQEPMVKLNGSLTKAFKSKQPWQ